MIKSLRYLCGIRRNTLPKYTGRVTIATHFTNKFQGFGFNGTSRRYTNIKTQGRTRTSEISESKMESCTVQNGMRLVCECKDSFTTTIGCYLPAGSMYEMPEERGSSLFLEHLLFRRTKCKSQQELEKQLEEIAGTVNIVAKRDMFIFHGTVPSCDIEKLIEIFAEVIINGVICETDVQKEKWVILKQLNGMEPNKEKVVMDYLQNIAFQDTEIEKSIYPETNVIKNFCAEKLISFRNRLFRTCFMTLVSIGPLNLQNLQEIICEYFLLEPDECKPLSGLHIPPKSREPMGFRFSGGDFRFRDDDEQVGYVALGFEGPNCKEREDHFVFTVAKEIVGSWSKLSGGQNHNAPYIAHCAFNTDLCELYRTFFFNLADTSIWGCYFVSDRLKLWTMIKMLQKEWMRLCTTITQKEVDRAVNQCKMNELMILNDPLEHFYDIVTSLFKWGYYEPIQQRLRRYERIQTRHINEVFIKYIYDGSPAVVALGRIENLPDYCSISNGLYLLRY